MEVHSSGLAESGEDRLTTSPKKTPAASSGEEGGAKAEERTFCYKSELWMSIRDWITVEKKFLSERRRFGDGD